MLYPQLKKTNTLDSRFFNDGDFYSIRWKETMGKKHAGKSKPNKLERLGSSNESSKHRTRVEDGSRDSLDSGLNSLSALDADAHRVSSLMASDDFVGASIGIPTSDSTVRQSNSPIFPVSGMCAKCFT